MKPWKLILLFILVALLMHMQFGAVTADDEPVEVPAPGDVEYTVFLYLAIAMNEVPTQQVSVNESSPVGGDECPSPYDRCGEKSDEDQLILLGDCTEEDGEQ